jgi:hypothetical protein
MKERLPRRCECGGKMKYEFSMGRIFGYCLSCTPVVTVSKRVLERVSGQNSPSGERRKRCVRRKSKSA